MNCLVKERWNTGEENMQIRTIKDEEKKKEMES